MRAHLTIHKKNQYLGKAKALLFPIEWDEPFGIVMIEAMACGTPVIAFKRGSVPEVIDENITGFIVNTDAQMIDAVNHISDIDRAACSQQAMQRFNITKIAAEYLSL
jgi:glycosyltransferase involved in cell wall biosynthesis